MESVSFSVKKHTTTHHTFRLITIHELVIYYHDLCIDDGDQLIMSEADHQGGVRNWCVMCHVSWKLVCHAK